MNNTVPVKRMTKDGIMTTKHVRADPNASKLRTALPAPKLSVPAAPAESLRKRAYKAGTKRQQEVMPRSFTASVEDPTPELVSSLGIDADLGVYRFKASESGMYEMMAFMSTGNALAFHEAGVKSSVDALDYLRSNGMDDLIVFNDMPLEAQERRIPIVDYMRETRRRPQEMLDNPLFMDSVEMSGINALREHDKELTHEVRHGIVRLEDIKTVGVTRIKGSVGWEEIHDALKKLADGSAKFTADDLKFAVEKFGHQSNTFIENSLQISEMFGPETQREINRPDWSMFKLAMDLKKENNSEERIKDILCYRDKYLMTTDFGSKNSYTNEEVIRFFDAGVSSEDMSSGRITLLQLDAIQHHGIAPSVSEGWL